MRISAKSPEYPAHRSPNIVLCTEPLSSYKFREISALCCFNATIPATRDITAESIIHIPGDSVLTQPSLRDRPSSRRSIKHLIYYNTFPKFNQVFIAQLSPWKSKGHIWDPLAAHSHRPEAVILHKLFRQTTGLQRSPIISAASAKPHSDTVYSTARSGISRKYTDELFSQMLSPIVSSQIPITRFIKIYKTDMINFKKMPNF